MQDSTKGHGIVKNSQRPQVMEGHNNVKTNWRTQNPKELVTRVY